MPTIRAISFDAAGTLLHAHPSVGHVYAEVLARYGPTVDADAMEAAFRRAFGERRGGRSPSGESALRDEGYFWWRELVFDVMDSLRLEVRQRDEFFRELYWRFAHADVWRLFPDVMPALLEVRARGLRTALLSNWDVRLRRVLQEMGVASLFDTMVISSEVGIEKPDPKIFLLMCERLGVNPGQTLHVGDNRREDIEGAEAAGLNAVLIERGKTPGSTSGAVPSLMAAVASA